MRGRPFVKGQSGNPKGRAKKGETLTDILRAISDEPDGRDGFTKKQALGRRLYKLAMTGKGQVAVAAIKYIYDRIDGSPRQAIALDANMDITYRVIPRRKPTEESSEHPAEDQCPQ